MDRKEVNTANQFDFLAGELLLVNKPKEWTSFDVVNKLRFKLKYALKIKKIKVGHAGTLDPLATGLLLICTGKKTKELSAFQGLDKKYQGVIRIGATTPSYDAEYPVDKTFPTDHITTELLDKVRTTFIGPIAQIPPIFSAIKVDGKPLYKKARKGESVKVEPRNVIIHDLQFTQIQWPDLHFEVKCSKGTYIRSLAHDIGKALESGAYLYDLCRTAIGTHRLEDAWELEELISEIERIS